MTRRPAAALLAVLALWPVLASAAPPRPPSEAPAALLERARAAAAAHRGAEVESLAVEAKTLLESEAHPDTVLLARALGEICHARNLERIFSDSVGVHAGARSIELLDACGSAPDTLRFVVRRNLGWTYSQVGRSEDGIAQYRAARALARRHPEWGGTPITVVLYNLGTAFANVGACDSALAVFRESLAGRKRIGMPRDVLPGEILAGMGMVFEQQGRDDEAEQAFLASIRSDEDQLGPGNGYLIGPLTRAGDFEFRRGDYASSIDFNRRALRLYAPLVPPGDTNLLLIRCAVAQALEQLGEAGGARLIYEEALPTLETRLGRRHRDCLAGWLSLASACRKLGDRGAADGAYRQVEAAFAADTSLEEAGPLAVALAGRASLQMEEGDPDSALALAARALAVNDASGAPEVRATLEALCTALSVHSGRGDWAAADSDDAHLGRVLARIAPPGDDAVDQVWITRSESAERRGRPAEAVAAAVEGARRSRERLVQNVRALSDRQALGLAGSLSGPLDRLLEVAVGSDSTSVRRAWDEVVRVRGLVRAEVAARRPPESARADTSLARAYANWVRAERNLARFEVRAAVSARGEAAESTLTALRAEVDETGRLLGRDLSGAALPDPSVVGLDSVLTGLRPGSALVAFVTAPVPGGGRHLVAFLAKGRSPAVRSLDLGGVDELAALVRRWRAALGEPDPERRSEEACRRAGEAVRARIWDPVARAAPDVRVAYIVPEAPVDGLPWGALPTAGGRYLVESGPEIHELEAERDLLPAAGPSLGRGLLAVGDVNFAREAADSLVVSAASRSFRGGPSGCGGDALRDLPPLPGTGDEIRGVAAVWSRDPRASGPALLLDGDRASEAAFKQFAPGREVLHLATHGIALADTCEPEGAGSRGVGGVAPVSSAGAAPPSAASSEPRPASPWLGRYVLLALAGADRAFDHPGDENEGLLTAEEVTTLDLRGVDWVVLSACRSAEGEVWSREGVLGMQRAFRLAGARTVIASRWSVDDASTSEWMQALYAARAEGRDAAGSVSEAERTVLAARRRSGRSTHPFYWAAFNADGE